MSLDSIRQKVQELRVVEALAVKFHCYPKNCGGMAKSIVSTALGLLRPLGGEFRIFRA